MLASQETAARNQDYLLTEQQKSPASTLIGAHLITNQLGEPAMLLVLSRYGAFYMAQFGDEDGSNALLGYGIGAYCHLSENLHFYVPGDTANAPGCPSMKLAPYILKVVSSTSATTTFATTGSQPETFSAKKIAKDQGEMAGSWKLDSHDVVIVFDGDDTAGDYYLIEFGSSAMETKWTEAGTYTRSGDVIIPVPHLATDTDESGSDMDGSFMIQIHGNSMRFLIEEPDGVDEVTLSRID